MADAIPERAMATSQGPRPWGLAYGFSYAFSYRVSSPLDFLLIPIVLLVTTFVSGSITHGIYRLRLFELSNANPRIITSHAHADVLRELTLRNIQVRGEKAWEDVAKDLCGPMKLNFVSLSSMSDEVSSILYGNPYIGHVRTVQTAHNFMRWIREGEYGMATRWYAAVAWHKENYVPKAGIYLVDGDHDDNEHSGDDEDEDEDIDT